MCPYRGESTCPPINMYSVHPDTTLGVLVEVRRWSDEQVPVHRTSYIVVPGTLGTYYNSRC